jgi:hypothetical protein
MTCVEAIREVFREDPREHTAAEVVAKVADRYPEVWVPGTIRATLIGLCVNHGSAHHYPAFRRHAFLFTPGRGRFQPLGRVVEKHVVMANTPLPARRRRVRSEPMGRQAAARLAGAQQAVTAQERAAAIQQLVDELHQDAFQPRYRREPYGNPVTGWPARLRSYFWPHPVMDLRATAETLAPWFDEAGALSRRLLDGAGWGSEERRRAAVLAWSMLTWGGVTRQEAFSEATVEAVYRRALGLDQGEGAPMNSGWTKVAAMATAFLEGEWDRAPHVIWDSRVSTSIVWRLDRTLAETRVVDPKRSFLGLGVVGGRGGTRPRSLRLRWAHPYGRWWGQEAGSAIVREIRDVLNEGSHGWMPLPDGGEGRWTIRGVESVLFMDGY